MALTNAYGTLPQLAEQVTTNGQVLGSDWDDKLERAGNSAARRIDGYCGRWFWQDASVTTRDYYADSPYECCVDDISTVTDLVVKIDSGDDGTFATTLTIDTDFILLPRNAADRTPVWPYTEIVMVGTASTLFPMSSSRRPGVRVIAKFGWPAVPADVTTAWLMLSTQQFDVATNNDDSWQALVDPYVKVYA